MRPLYPVVVKAPGREERAVATPPPKYRRDKPLVTRQISPRNEVVIVGMSPMPCGCGCGIEVPERHLVPYGGKRLSPECFARETVIRRGLVTRAQRAREFMYRQREQKAVLRRELEAVGRRNCPEQVP